MFEPGDIVRRIYGRILGKPMNFSFIDDYVSGSARPFSQGEIEWLKKNGIQSILSLTEKPISKNLIDGLDYANVPMVNHAIPTDSQLRESVDFLVFEREQNHKTDVHCAAGKGRTGTVLAAYLCKSSGLDPGEAISQIRSKRPGSIEKKQERAVFSFYEQLKKNDEKRT
jgi:atypical dual specificity phosphatase